MKVFTLHPSALSWIAQDCKRCMWRTFRGVKRPVEVGAAISVGNMFDQAAKSMIAANNAKKMGVPYDLTSAVAMEYVRSRVFEIPRLGVGFQVSGKIDRMFVDSSGLNHLIDFKAGVGDPKRYWLSLMAYLMAIEQPIKGTGLEVDSIGVLQFGLKQCEVRISDKSNRASIIGEISYEPFVIDRSVWMADIEQLIEECGVWAVMPEAGYWCDFCKSVEAAQEAAKVKQ